MAELPYRKTINAKGRNCLIISDLHFPYAHPDWYIFLKAIKEKYKPDIIVNVGDEVDGHRWSFHDSDESLPSADEELQKAIDEIQHLRELFPTMYLCESNHGSLAYRRVKHHGLPLRFLKSLGELYVTPCWEWFHEIIIKTEQGDISVVHGKTGSYNKLSVEQGVSSVQGHFHQKFEITWQQSVHRAIFNMIVGCLIDVESLAFGYGKNISKRPMLGVGWINEIGEPVLIRMRLTESGDWDGKL